MNNEEYIEDQKTRETCKSCDGRGMETNDGDTCCKCGGRGETTHNGYQIELDNVE